MTEAVEKVGFYPQTPQGGLSKSLDFNKSPLGDLGVSQKKLTFSTPHTLTEPQVLTKASGVSGGGGWLLRHPVYRGFGASKIL